MRCNPFSHGGVDELADRRLFRDRDRPAGAHDHEARRAMIPLANILQPLIDVADVGDRLPARRRRPRAGASRSSALTFITRLLILPLSIKQIRSMRRLQRTPRELKALQEKYKDDRQRLQREMMAFYQENKVNPFASCLPLLLQLPVFISLY